MSETDTTANVDGERREFKAEIKKLLDILIHSVYTSKDVFVRELISNAADALEKARFRQASGETLQDSDLPLEIGLETNEEDRILVITDTGIGMTADEVNSQQDGTMVVVEGGREQIGKVVVVDVTKMLQTSAGRMVFGRFMSLG